VFNRPILLALQNRRFLPSQPKRQAVTIQVVTIKVLIGVSALPLE
jgi:hypothetical protein